ncbi:MAG TPA: Ppx/GppA phosphatase family protein [Acidimicrobiales bacterium]|jgi:exopolyphosphatase/guanosine-5'-triphosphate,3'-diphosphate pyrophosphatase
MSETTAVAAVDCGTNSTRLLVVATSGEVVAREMRITRLGAGVDATRRLQPEAIARTLEVLGEYRAIMDAAGVGRARLVATSAVRDAANRDAFLEPASGVVGVRAELLSGEQEGRLSYAGATADLPPLDGQTVVVDIGGGSTEIVTMAGGDIAAVSLDIGCVRLTERFLRGDPPSQAEVADAVGAIGRELDRATSEIPSLGALGPRDRLVGLAGTVSTLAALELGLTGYERDRIHHSVLSRHAVEKWCDVLGTERVRERAQRVAITEGRQDVIFGGALVLRECLSRFELAECIVSEADILDGLVLSQGAAGSQGAAAR